MTALRAILAVLGAYRLAFLVAYEDGPADAATHLRTFVARRWGGTWVHRGIHCPLCISFWTALLLAVLSRSNARGAALLVEWLGVAGAALTLHELLQKDA